MSSMRPFFTMGRYFLIALIGIIALPSDCRGTIHWIKSQSHYIISSTLSSKKHVLGFMLPLYKHISSYIYMHIYSDLLGHSLVALQPSWRFSPAVSSTKNTKKLRGAKQSPQSNGFSHLIRSLCSFRV